MELPEDMRTKTDLTENSEMTPSITDPLGSYTGVPQDWGEVPIQDADDL